MNGADPEALRAAVAVHGLVEPSVVRRCDVEVVSFETADAIRLSRATREVAVAAGFTPVAFGGIDMLVEEWEDRGESDGWPDRGLAEAAAFDGPARLAATALFNEEHNWGPGHLELRLQRPDGSALQPGDAGFLPEAEGDLRPIDDLHLIYADQSSVVFVPSAIPWHVPVLLDWTVGNAITPVEHAAVWRHWYERFGAIPLAMQCNSLTLEVPAPVADPAAAFALAVEHLAYDFDVLGVNDDVDTLNELAARLAIRSVWRFSWD